MQALASKTYGQVQHRTAGNREIEYALFDQVTEALKSVAAGPEPRTFARIDAISRNMQLWSALAADLLSPENALPLETRRGLVILSEFVRREGMKRLSDDGDLEDLISVNETVMVGLGASHPFAAATEVR